MSRTKKHDTEFSAAEWARLLSRSKWQPSVEHMVATTNSRKTIRIRKDQWRRWFRGWDGVELRQGQEIELVQGGGDGPKVELPDWAREHLALAAGDGLCVTERGGSFFLKRLRLVARPTRVPGCTVIDKFAADEVLRTYSLHGELGPYVPSEFAEVLNAVGRFKYDPLAPLKDVAGRVGLLARKELLGGWSKADKAAAAAYRKSLTTEQMADGSWQGSVIHTSCCVIRLLEAGARPTVPAIDRACRWLLSTPEPTGFPGLFLCSPELTAGYNDWRHETGGVWKQFRVPRTFQPKGDFADNSDLFGIAISREGGCHKWSLWSSAAALEALLRCGYVDHQRVVRAINGLLIKRFGGGTTIWCANCMRRSDLSFVDSTAEPDFNLPTIDMKADRVDWPMSARDVLGKVAGEEYRQWALGNDRSAMMREPYGALLDCSAVVQRALSWHPDHRGSTVEMTTSLEHASEQGWDGSWPANRVSLMLSLLERLDTSVAALAVLRSVPLLVRYQGDDGLWDEAQLPQFHDPRDRDHTELSPLPKEANSYMILKALKQFGFLDALLPD